MAYDAVNPKDLSLTTPTAGTGLVSELDNAIREIKKVIMASSATVTTTSAATYQILETDYLVVATASGPTIMLPLISSVSSTTAIKEVIVVNAHASAALTIVPYSGNTCAVTSIAAGEMVHFICIGGAPWIPSRTYQRASKADTLLVGSSYRSTATAATANTIVVRDSIGDFSAHEITATLVISNLSGNVTGDVVGDVTGNATTATEATTAVNASGTGTAIQGQPATKIISGVVAADGTITSGTDFTVTSFTGGNLVISFTLAFSAAPAVIPTTINGLDLIASACVNSVSGSGAVIKTMYGTTPTSIGVHFIAIGLA